MNHRIDDERLPFFHTKRFIVESFLYVFFVCLFGPWHC